MRVKDLLKESDLSDQQPKDKKDKLRNELKKIWSVIERFEKTGEIHRDDKPKMDTFKDFIKDMVKDDENRV